MDAYTAIRGKRDVRSYQDQPIPADALRRILQAGRMAGSAKNAQPCRFVVLQKPEDKERLAQCGHFSRHVPSAPLVIAIVVPGPGFDFDVGRAAQNMMLAAWADGIASCPVTMHEAECAQGALNLPPDHRVAIAIAFGYPAPDTSRPNRPRLPLDDLIHHGSWH